MSTFLKFLSLIGEELYDLFVYAMRDDATPNPEAEKQLAARILRKASDAQIRRDLGL